MKVRVNTLNNKKDLIHAGNAVTMFKDVIGESLTLTGIIIYEKEEVDEKTGAIDTKVVSCIKNKDGEFISSISPTIENSLNLILGAFEPDEITQGIDILVKGKKSKNNREFIYIDVA